MENTENFFIESVNFEINQVHCLIENTSNKVFNNIITRVDGGGIEGKRQKETERERDGQRGRDTGSERVWDGLRAGGKEKA